MRLDDFDFPLPKNLIAQRPAPRRGDSRMMVVDRHSLRWENRVFADLPDLLSNGDLLVWNNTRVFPARLTARRPGRNEGIEVLLVRETAPGEWIALVKPARKAAAGQPLLFGDRLGTVCGQRDDGSRELRFEDHRNLLEDLETLGTPPLPPYIRRDADTDWTEDRLRYQTVYARHTGSVAAPTAGLHFTPEIISRIEQRGVRRAEVLLHVGYGTFQPVRCAEIERHRMDPEWFEVTPEAAETINRCRSQGARVLSVGSTTTRVLEHSFREGQVRPGAGLCDLFIRPGYCFQVVDSLLTNFHLPRSTLFMLVCAFAGREFMHECYRAAVAGNYSFFSYGDCMLIL